MNAEDLLREAPVSEPEARSQLARIIGHPLFGGDRTRAQPLRIAEVLVYVVDRTLRNVPTAGQDILDDIFRNPSLGASDAKFCMSEVRKQLKRYYASAGVNDLVDIKIAVGKYRASIKYNARSSALKDVKRGYYHIQQEAPGHTAAALIYFERAIESAPTFSEAYAGKAAALLTHAIHSFTQPPVDSLSRAMAAAQQARTLNENSWGACLNIAAAHLFRHEWKSADREYERAEKMRPVDILLEGGFGPYLLCRGHYSRAADLAQFYLNEHSTDVVFLRRAALYLYLLRRFDEAEAVTKEIIGLDKRSWLGHMMWVYIHLATERPFAALSHMRNAALYSDSDIWPGLYILCLAQTDELDEATERFTALRRLSEQSYVQPMQLALAYMALHQPQEAVRRLDQACEELDMFTIWLHLLPFLDPLRKYSDFQQLLKKGKYASAPL